MRKIGFQNLTPTRYMEDKNKIKQENAASILPEELVRIDCSMQDSQEETHFAKYYKGQKIMEGHDNPPSERKLHILYAKFTIRRWMMVPLFFFFQLIIHPFLNLILCKFLLFLHFGFSIFPSFYYLSIFPRSTE